MPTSAPLIRLIHVAKRQLALDDDSYRALLAGAAGGKTSCAAMNEPELEAVLDAMQQAGFKRRVNPAKKRRLSPAAGTPVKVAEIAKIRAIWITMARHGVVRDGSETALNSYVKRQTSRSNGVGVAEVAWLDEPLANQVLEALKAWHWRAMVACLVKAGCCVPRNERTGQPAGYAAILAAFEQEAEA